MEVQKEFDEYMEKYLKGKELPEVAEIQKKNDNSKYKFRDDGHGRIADLDMYMPDDEAGTDEQEISLNIYHNIWEMLKVNFIGREVVETVDMKYNNILNIVEELEVTLISGDVAVFKNVQLG